MTSSADRYVHHTVDGDIVQERDGLIIYRASALGSSFKTLVAARLGYEQIAPPEAMQKVFDAGHTAEDTVLDKLRQEGWRLYDEQKEVILPITGKIAVVGHIDSKGYHNGEGRVVEVKSQGQREWDQFESQGWSSGLFPKYEWQVSAYLLAEHLGLCLVRYNRATGQMATSYLDSPPKSLRDIRSRILQVEFQAATGELPEDRVCEDYPCPFFYLHAREQRVVLYDPQIRALAQEYEDAKRDEKAAKGRKQSAFTALKDACGDELKLETEDGWKVTFYEARNPQRKLVTRDAMSTFLASWASAVLEPYMESSKSWRVRITPATEKGNDDRRGTEPATA